NLDGGGSTTMAVNYYGDKGPTGANYASRLVNSPIGTSNLVSSERTVGTNLAMFAAPNPAFQFPSAAAIPAHVTILDDFESSEGRFSGGATASGSSFGVAASSRIDRVTNESHYGIGSQRITVQSSN